MVIFGNFNENQLNHHRLHRRECFVYIESRRVVAAGNCAAGESVRDSRDVDCTCRDGGRDGLWWPAGFGGGLDSGAGDRSRFGGARADDLNAPACRDPPQLRRFGGGFGRDRDVFGAAQTDDGGRGQPAYGRDIYWSLYWFGHIYGFRHCVSQTARNRRRQAFAASRPAPDKYHNAAWDHRPWRGVLNLAGCGNGSHTAYRCDDSNRHSRRSFCNGDRRRGHACRRFDAQQLFRLGRGRGGLYAWQ